jgi:hypothetical protein
MQSGEDPIFEIAVYRKSPHALEKEYDCIFEKGIQRCDPYHPLSNTDRETQEFKYMQNHFWEKHGEPYPYNQVIGWVVLAAKRDQVLAEYYKTTEKRLTRNCRRHRVMGHGKCFAIYLAGNETPKKIVTRILEKLRLLSIDDGPFEGRYVDTKAFMRLAPYINWKKLIRESS